MFVDRQTEIINAVNEALRMTANWIRDLQKGDSLALPPMIVTALRNMVIVCEGGLPDDCRDLYVAVQKLAEELRQYIQQYDGKINPNGSPVGSFWNALSGVEGLINKVDAPYISQLESVKELREQKVSDDQIAFNIYGLRGKGPFVTRNGTVNKRLIDEACASLEAQDRILAIAGWEQIEGAFYPPWMTNVNTAKRAESADRMKALKALEEGPKANLDPATIKEMLEDGCYVQQIERGKNVTRNEVLEVAKEHGLVPVDEPGWTAKRPLKPSVRPTAPQTIEVDPNSDEESDPLEQVLNAPEKKNGRQKTEVPDLLRTAIVACIDGNPTFGTAEIMEFVEADGMDATPAQIAEVMKGQKKRLAQR